MGAVKVNVSVGEETHTFVFGFKSDRAFQQLAIDAGLLEVIDKPEDPENTEIVAGKYVKKTLLWEANWLFYNVLAALQTETPKDIEYLLDILDEMEEGGFDRIIEGFFSHVESKAHKTVVIAKAVIATSKQTTEAMKA